MCAGAQVAKGLKSLFADSNVNVVAAAVRALELARNAEGRFRGEAVAHGLRSTEKWACLEPAVRADAAAAAGGDGLDRLNNIYLRPLHGLLRAKLLLAICVQTWQFD